MKPKTCRQEAAILASITSVLFALSLTTPAFQQEPVPVPQADITTVDPGRHHAHPTRVVPVPAPSAPEAQKFISATAACQTSAVTRRKARRDRQVPHRTRRGSESRSIRSRSRPRPSRARALRT